MRNLVLITPLSQQMTSLSFRFILYYFPNSSTVSEIRVMIFHFHPFVLHFLLHEIIDTTLGSLT
jgi:hypothetical protein